MIGAVIMIVIAWIGGIHAVITGNMVVTAIIGGAVIIGNMVAIVITGIIAGVMNMNVLAMTGGLLAVIIGTMAVNAEEVLFG